MGNFRKLKIWQLGMKIAKQTYELAKKLPEYERFGLVSQIQRAAISIPSNIAEGSSRNSQKEFKRFVEFSLGSCYELETQLQIISDQNMGDAIDIEALIDLVIEEQKMIHGFKNKLANS